MSKSIFQNDEARKTLQSWYDRFLAQVKTPSAHLEVATSRGPSHVLAVGDKKNPPLIVLHGSLASSAHLAREVERLTERFYLLAPDLPGQSPRGPEFRLPFDGKSHAEWLIEVLDGLGVSRADILGVSWGGYVALQTAIVAPSRIKKLVLVTPAGVVRGSAWQGITRMLIPMMMYRRSPTEARLRKFFNELFSNWDPEWAEYFGSAMQNFVLDFTPPPLAKKEALASLTMPTLVFAATGDVSFPGSKLLDRMKDHVPGVHTEILEGAKHSPPTTDEFRAWFTERVGAFLAN